MREYQNDQTTGSILSKPPDQGRLDGDASLAMQQPSSQPGHAALATAASVLQLQRQFGNRYVQRMLALSRKGEGEGEVTRDVESSIERARGTGQQLEHGTRQQMESAFGADFGGVRVHTGEQAHALNRAVGAVAFTTGQDVFFRDGAYSPESPGGKELLAHELTHVVQQGGAPAVQTKLVVGAADDVYEREAEQTAREIGSILRSEPSAASLDIASSGNTQAGIGLSVPSSGSVQRSKTDDLTEMANAGGQAAIENQQQGIDHPPIMQVSNVGDVQAARSLAEQIGSWRDNMQEGSKATGAFVASPNRVTSDKMSANEQAVSALDDYLVTAGEQSRTLGSFQDAVGKARVNYQRLKAQVTHLTVTNTIAGGTASQIGQQVVQSTGLKDTDSAQQTMQQREVQNAGFQAVHNQVQDAHDAMVTLGESLGKKQGIVSQTAYAYRGALDTFKTGVPTVNDNPDQAKELSELKEKIEEVKKYVGKGLELAGKAAETAGVKGADTVGEHAGIAVDWLTDQYFDPKLNDIQTKLAQYNTAHKENAISASLDNVRAASRAFTAAVSDFKDTVERFAHAQATFRDKLRMLGRTADAGHGDKYGQVAAVLAEVDTYETQLDEALRLGYQEQTASQEASSSRRTAESGSGEGGEGNAFRKYYRPYKFFHANGGWGYECEPVELRIQSPISQRGSAQGATNIGANATVDDAIKLLQESRTEVDPMRRALAQAMDLNMDKSMPTPLGGPAATSRGANTGL